MKTQPALEGRNGPDSYRKTAIAVGVVYLLGMVVGIVGNGLIQSIVAAPDHLSIVSANSLLLAGGAMLMLLAAFGDAAHGILMSPILKRRGERLALGYLGYRIVDAAFIGLWVLFLLLQIPLGREYLNAAGTDAGRASRSGATGTTCTCCSPGRQVGIARNTRWNLRSWKRRLP